MKKIFTLLLIIGSSLLAKASTNDGTISVTNLSRQDISVEIDGRTYGNCDPAITISDLKPGMYTVRVYSEKGYGKNSKRTMLYSHMVRIKPRFFVDIIVNRFNKVFYDEQVVNERWRDDDDDDSNNRHAGRAMNDQSFQSFKATVSKEPFNDSKLTIAKQVVDQNYFTTDQVTQLISLFSFDDTKLDIAKYMYGRTLDKENYFVVYNSFAFSSSKEKLAEYIKSCK